ncbi:MAG: amidase [Polyangiaceae bacterium]
MSLLSNTLVELTVLLKSRKVSPVELMRETLERIDQVNPQLNALVCPRDPDVLMQEAKAAEARLMAGEGRIFEGLALGVKDLEDAAGLINSQGSLLFKEQVATRDSIQVERLKAAGAIVIGKTNAPEFGTTAITKNLVYGTTTSPWDVERTPGGSSGGSAALLAAEALPLNTSSDGGGSIRIPASFVGAFGFKPSMGRVARGPFEFWDSGRTSVWGPLTKTVEDAALFLDQVVGHHPLDPMSLPHPGFSYFDHLEQARERKWRIAYSPDLGYAVVQSDVARVVAEAVRVFEAQGHSVEQIEGGPPELGADWGLIGAFELGSHLAPQLQRHAELLQRSVLRTIRMAETGLDLEWWGEASRRRAQLSRWVAEVFGEYDLLLTPTVPYDPPPAKGPFPAETEGRLQRVASVASFTIPFNLSWNPAASVRAGLSDAGLPVGLQIVGPLQRDELVLEAAQAFQRARPWHPQWPLRSPD